MLDLLAPRPGGVYVDATVGAGGHAEAILARAGPGSRLIGMDRDHEALAAAADRLARFGPAVTLVHGNFTALRDVLTARGVEAVDGIVVDLGISSLQLADPERGFSFQVEGPLDMRMDRSRPETAADLINRLSEEQIRQMLRDYGQERWAGRIARRIVRMRPLQSTTELADVVAGAVPRRQWPRHIHPATRTFQALRIAVNHELDDLEEALPNVVEGLGNGGRLCVITFHSLEDHIVKHTFLCLSRGYPSGLGPSTRMTRAAARRPGPQPGRWAGPGGPMDAAGVEAGASGPRVRVLTRKPVTPSAEEVARNARARSAKLRAVERLSSTS